MRVVTWNMGCAFQGSKYRASHEEAWGVVDALEPDLALLQEVSQIPAGIDPAKLVGSPRNGKDGFQTVLYARSGSVTRLQPDSDVAPALLGQAVMAEFLGVSSEPFVIASIHTITGIPKPWQKAAFDALPPERRARLPKDKGSWNAQIILDAVAGTSVRRRLIVGGDFNAAWRFDETNAPDYWASAQFQAIRNQGWRRPHLKFHAGEERTFFRKPHELFQFDHFFVDEQTWEASTRCDVVQLNNQERLSDHAPLLLEVAA